MENAQEMMEKGVELLNLIRSSAPDEVRQALAASYAEGITRGFKAAESIYKGRQDNTKSA